MARKPSTKPAPPENETKEEKFLRLAQPRVGAVVIGIRRLHALGGSGYASTEDQRAKIFLTLRQEIAAEQAMKPKEKGSTADKASAFTF